MQKYLLLLMVLYGSALFAQKKTLDHTVYDNWKSISERSISNNGQFVVYTVTPQEGDGELVIQNPHTKYKKTVPRGYAAVITEDSRYLIFKIKAPFADTRQAKIKKRKADEMPKDSLGIIELGKDSIYKIPRIKSFKTPEKASGYVAIHLEKPLPDTTKKKAAIDSARIQNDQLVKLADSIIKKSIDSIKGNISKEELAEIINKAATKIIKEGKDTPLDAEGDDANTAFKTEGTVLIFKNLYSGTEKKFELVNEYHLDKKGTKLLIETSKKPKDSLSQALILLYNITIGNTDTLLRSFNDAGNYSFDETGTRLAFTAERDSSEKALQKFYKLWYYEAGQDSALLIADKNTVGMQLGYTVSEHAQTQFSKDGTKLFFGNAPIKTPKDTTLVEFETAKLDIWHYKEDYLQTQQLKNLDAELKRSYTAVYHLYERKLVQLGSEGAENITIVNEGDAGWVLAETNKAYRIATQWEGRTKSDAFIINLNSGIKTQVYKGLYANAEASPAGKYVYWYDNERKNYYTYEVATGITRNITDKITVPLFDEENDVPDFARPYGVMSWHQGDSAVYVYDQFDFWKINPANSNESSRPFEGFGRRQQVTTRYIRTNKEERFLKSSQPLLFRLFGKKNKQAALMELCFGCGSTLNTWQENKEAFSLLHPKNFTTVVKAKDTAVYIFSMEDFASAPDLYYGSRFYYNNIRLSDINPQQKEYSWGTAELFKWKAYNGKEAEGIVYKPEGFDPKKKYPLICYFYEKLSDGLYNYIAPAPTPSRLNISFFVSRGYVVLAPDIEYHIGHPGNSAYDYIVSGARALIKQGFIDSTKTGLQGQSWGGYQTAYIITRTNLFKAAWAGAPVANMTSAYGGIRWESGLNRQFQYEKTQSRIGATLWEKPQLYIENSPLFHLPKVQTPIVIMHNDADGAVPWYQGIELFTGLRRLGKPVWMLNYNGEAHNLVERRNRKDIQIREQQFFDWLLKGEKAPKWISTGVPATEKGKDWGLEVD